MCLFLMDKNTNKIFKKEHKIFRLSGEFGIMKEAFIYIIGSFMVQGFNFITLPVFAALMTTYEFGIYTSYENWTTIMAAIIGLQTTASVTNAYIDYSKAGIRSYVSSVCSLAWISCLIAITFTCCLCSFLTDIFELGIKELYVGILQCLFLYFLNLYMAECRVLNKPIQYLMVSFLNTVLTVVGGIGFLYLIPQAGHWGRILGTSMAACLVGGFAAFIIYTQGKKWIDKSNLRYALALSFPLIFHAFSGILMGKTDQMMLLKMTSPEEMGIYSYGNKIGHVIYVLYTAINQAFVPWYYKKRKQDQIFLIKKSIRLYIDIFSFLCICILTILPEAIKFFSPTAYYGSIYTTPLIIAGFYINFLYTFPVNYEFFHKKTKYIAGGTTICAFANVILNASLIPLLGGYGAAITTIISYIILLFIHLWIAQKVIGQYELCTVFFLIRTLFILGTIGIYFIIVDQIVLRWGFAALSGIFIVGKIIINYRNISSIE